MARWLGIFFASGATLALAGLLLRHVPYRNTVATALLAASGYPVALLLFWVGRRLSIGAFHVLTAAGTLIVTLAIALGHGSRLADLSPLFYMWVPIFGVTVGPDEGPDVHLLNWALELHPDSPIGVRLHRVRESPPRRSHHR